MRSIHHATTIARSIGWRSWPDAMSHIVTQRYFVGTFRPAPPPDPTNMNDARDYALACGAQHMQYYYGETDLQPEGTDADDGTYEGWCEYCRRIDEPNKPEPDLYTIPLPL